MAVCAGHDFSSPILGCDSCGCAYAGKSLSPADLSRYYSALSKYDTIRSLGDISSMDRERARMAADFVMPGLDLSARLLDVGCSTGMFLRTLRDRGLRHATGIDPAADAPEAARKLFGISVVQAQAETYRDYGSHDLICLMAVLEHVLQPAALVQEIGRQMRQGAALLIEVPDAGAFDRPEDSGPFEPFGEFSNEHINFLSIGDIGHIAHAAGLTVVRWRSFRVAAGAPGLFVCCARKPPQRHCRLRTPEAP